MMVPEANSLPAMLTSHMPVLVPAAPLLIQLPAYGVEKPA